MSELSHLAYKKSLKYQNTIHMNSKLIDSAKANFIIPR